MKIFQMQLKIVVTIILCFFSTVCMANKYDVMLGGYTYSASVQGKTTSLSGAGTYEAAYLLPFSDHFEANLGYSFTMTGIIGGDYTYGPKLGVNYYPINFSSSEKLQFADKTIIIHDYYKPYIGVAFNQRQFQSAKTSLAGLGVMLGCEKYINSNYTIKSEVKMNSYTGASAATASEVNILIGLVFEI